MNVSIIKGTTVAYDPAQIDLKGEIGKIYGQRDKGEDTSSVQNAIRDLVTDASGGEKNPVKVEGANYELMTPAELAKMKKALEQADGGVKGTYTLAEFKKAQALLGNPMAEVDPFAETETAAPVETAQASKGQVVATITDAAKGNAGGYWYGFNGTDNTTQVVSEKKAIVKRFADSGDPGFGVVIGKPTKGATHLRVVLSSGPLAADQPFQAGYGKVVIQVFGSPSEERNTRVEYGFYPGGGQETGQWAPDHFASASEADSFFGGQKTTVLVPLGSLRNIQKLQIMIPGYSNGTISIYSVDLIKQ